MVSRWWPLTASCLRSTPSFRRASNFNIIFFEPQLKNSLPSFVPRLTELSPICSSSLLVITKCDRSLQQSMLFGGFGTTLLTILLSPYLYGSLAPMFPEVGSSCKSEVHVKEFDVPQRLSCPARLWTRKGSSNFDLCGILGYQYLFSQALSLMLRIVLIFSWDVLELSQRVLNFDESGLWTRQCALG